MDRRCLPWILLCVSSCASWRVVHQSDPCPYADESRFDVVELTFALDRAPPGETGFRSRRETIDRWRVDEDRRVIRDGFFEALFAHAQDAGIELRLVTTATAARTAHVIRPRVTQLDPGGPNVAAAMSSEIEVTVQIATRSGASIDTVALITGTDPSGGNFDRDSRLRRGAHLLGERTAMYLAERTGR